MNPLQLLADRSLERLIASRRGRAFLLHSMADAEESDEASVFDTLLERVDEPKLHALVRRHVADEQRHAELLHAAVRRVGVPPGPLPPELRYVPRVGAHLGFADDFHAGRVGVMEAYVLLGLIEERAVREWPRIVHALGRVDPETAAVVAGIVEDERRHVRWSETIARRYAPSAIALTRTERRYRAAEARAFAEHARVFLAHVVERDLLEVGRFERRFWRLLAA